MTYKIENDANHGILVVNNSGEVVGGPYKNEESAKRRIRDLKRKEVAPTEPQAMPHGAGAGAWSGNGGPIPNAATIAAMEECERMPERPRGVYPHVSKHSYRR